MFRKAQSAILITQPVGFRGRKGTVITQFLTGGGWHGYDFSLSFSVEESRSLLLRQNERPVTNKKNGDETWWMFQDVFWVEDEGLNSEEVKARVLDKRARERRKTERAVQAMEQRTIAEQVVARPQIADDVKIFIWQRDQGKCVNCGRTDLLEYDHIIPLHMGGSNTARNLQLLCESCNRLKGGNLT